MPIGVVIGLCSALLAALVTEVYCHRCLAHCAFRVNAAFASALDTYFLVIVGTHPETWAAVHRLHHRYADTPLDPHSPRLGRPLTVLAGSALLFARARGRVPTGPPRGRRIFVLRGVVVALYIAAFGPGTFLVIFAVHLIGYLGIMGMVNAVGHLFGRKTHAGVPGYDIAWLAVPLLGHGYHNSHHAHPAAARTGPLDPVWPLLRLLDAVRLINLDRPDREEPRACCRASVGASVA